MHNILEPLKQHETTLYWIEAQADQLYAAYQKEVNKKRPSLKKLGKLLKQFGELKDRMNAECRYIDKIVDGTD